MLAVNSSSFFSLVMLCTSILLALQLMKVQGTSVCETTLHKSGHKLSQMHGTHIEFGD